MGDFDLFGLEVFFTAFEKINFGFGSGLRSVRMAYSLGMHSSVWMYMIFVSLLNFGRFLEKAWWLLRSGSFSLRY